MGCDLITGAVTPLLTNFPWAWPCTGVSSPPQFPFCPFFDVLPPKPQPIPEGHEAGTAPSWCPPRATGGPAGGTGSYWWHWVLLVVLGPTGGTGACWWWGPLPWGPVAMVPVAKVPVATGGRKAAPPLRPAAARCQGRPWGRVAMAPPLPWEPSPRAAAGDRCGGGRCRKRGRPRPVCGSRDVTGRPVT